MCVWFVYTNELNQWVSWTIQAIHTFGMLTLTVSCIAIANDRISAIPEAAMLATPLMSDIIPQVCNNTFDK